MSNHQVFALAVANGLIVWHRETKEVGYRGMRHSLDVDRFGVPKIKQSPDLYNAIVASLPDVVYDLGESNSDNA